MKGKDGGGRGSVITLFIKNIDYNGISKWKGKRKRKKKKKEKKKSSIIW